MKISAGKIGRAFVIRLEDGDVIPDCIERFAAENGITHAQAILVGGVGGGEMVVGPRSSTAMPPEPMRLPVDGAHEVIGVGLLAPAADGRPILHIHGSLGRSGQSMTGCLRPGVRTWVVGEVVLLELLDIVATRLPDPKTGFTLLVPGAAAVPLKNT